MEKLTIGQMAKLNNVSEQTLRLYDKIDLLSPCIRGKENGYRYYDIRQSAVLDMIQYLKTIGLNLKEIKIHLNNKDIPGIKGILYEKKSHINDQIQEMKFQRRAIDRTIRSIERYETAPPDGTVLVEYIENRQIFYVDSKVNFYDFGIEEYEKILRELKDSLLKNSLPQIYFCHVGSILRQDKLAERQFVSTEIFVFVDQEFCSDKHVIKVPASYYLCIYCDSFQKEREYAERLLDEADTQGYTICGDYICEVIAELPVFDYSERGMYLRLQVPIQFNK